MIDLLCSKKGLTALFSGAIYDYFVDDGGDLLEPRFLFRRADGTREGKEVSVDELADDLLSGKKVLVLDVEREPNLVSLQDVRTAFKDLLQKEYPHDYDNPVTWFEREIDFYNSEEWNHSYNYHYFVPYFILDIWSAILRQSNPAAYIYEH
jgi:hypothetical protein